MSKEIPTTEGIAIVNWCCPECGTLNDDMYDQLDAYNSEGVCKKCGIIVKVEY